MCTLIGLFLEWKRHAGRMWMSLMLAMNISRWNKSKSNIPTRNYFRFLTIFVWIIYVSYVTSIQELWKLKEIKKIIFHFVKKANTVVYIKMINMFLFLIFIILIRSDSEVKTYNCHIVFIKCDKLLMILWRLLTNFVPCHLRV